MTALAPLVAVAGGAVIVLLLDAFLPKAPKSRLAAPALAFLAAAAAACVLLWDKSASAFQGRLRWDGPALLFTLILIAAAALAVLIGLRTVQYPRTAFGEFFGLLLLALSGLIVMVSSSDLLVVFLGLEVFSVSAYGLTGLRRGDDLAAEAALKYFLIGSFASAFMVFGLALLYGAAGSFETAALLEAVGRGGPAPLLPLLGLGLVVVGLAFKIALVPFHMWQPDVYEGAPTAVTAFFSVGPKTAGFLVLLRLLTPYWGGPAGREAMFVFLYAVSALTMILGNFAALRQRNLRRLLAYSSIAHAGTMMTAFLAGDGAALAFYLANYLFLGIGAFAVLAAVSREGREYGEVEDFSGIGLRYPWIGAIFSVILLSLAGIPPTGGFLAKYYAFSAAVRAGLTPLVILGVLTTLLSVAYYLRIISVMYMREPERAVAIDVQNPSVLLVLFLCLYGILQLGLFPGNILAVIRQAMAAIG